MRQPVQSINIPLTGDDAAVKKYAQEVEALKQKVRRARRGRSATWAQPRAQTIGELGAGPAGTCLLHNGGTEPDRAALK